MKQEKILSHKVNTQEEGRSYQGTWYQKRHDNR